MTDPPLWGAVATMATKHGKVSLVAPAMAGVGVHVDGTDAVDTDRFGTFTGEVERRDDAVTTARRKAAAGAEAGRTRYGLASEGTIGPHPDAPSITVSKELVVLLDTRAGLCYHGWAVGDGVVATMRTAAPDDDLSAVMRAADVPAHHLIVRPEGTADGPLSKGIARLDDLYAAVALCAAASPVGRARIETDLRADRCSSRRPIIRRAAEDLATRLGTTCGECGAAGFGSVDVRRGVRCDGCGETVGLVRSEIHGCIRCSHRVDVPTGVATAAPAACPGCNP